MPVVSAEADDWRKFRARLAASSRREEGDGAGGERVGAGVDGADEGDVWAHALEVPERGCLVLARPGVFGDGSQGYFERAAILLFSHGEEGSGGVILNKPAGTMGEMVGEGELEEFVASEVYLGGDVGETVLCLHGVKGVDGAVPVIAGREDGVWLGGLPDARARVRDGTSSSAEFKFYARHCGWGPGQLEGEVARGVWWLAAASPRVVMAGAGDPIVAAAEPEGGDKTGLWKAVCELMGGEARAHARAADSPGC